MNWKYNILLCGEGQNQNKKRFAIQRKAQQTNKNDGAGAAYCSLSTRHCDQITVAMNLFIVVVLFYILLFYFCRLFAPKLRYFCWNFFTFIHCPVQRVAHQIVFYAETVSNWKNIARWEWHEFFLLPTSSAVSSLFVRRWFILNCSVCVLRLIHLTRRYLLLRFRFILNLGNSCFVAVSLTFISQRHICRCHRHHHCRRRLPH